MYRACIALVDASRARLFAFERSHEIEGLREWMSEHLDLVNPARRRRPSELFSETRPGSSRVGGLQYTFDDHREDHLDELDAEFAGTVIDELGRLLDATGARRLILCASPKMLGALRAAGVELYRRGLAIDELPRDLVKLGAAEIRDRLAAHELLPPRPPHSGPAGER
ncbi:MAG TPA: host attachment protein [Kofleriaceae bacterium]|nr:host attachment protein [Kofleriaceae bacterium]